MINILLIAAIIIFVVLDVTYLVHMQNKAKKEGVSTGCLGCDSYKENKCDHKCVETTMELINKKIAQKQK